MGMETLLAIGGACAAIMAIFGLIKFVGVPLVKGVFEIRDFLRGWNGTPADNGEPARRGVLERLVSIEHELKTNGGSSVKDAVMRLEKQTAGIRTETCETNAKVDNLEKLFTDHISNA